jgi:hypothetical protein
MENKKIYKDKSIIKMMNKIYLILFLGIILMNSVNAEVESMGYVKMGNCIQLLQSAVNSTYSNITTISLPNKTEILSLNKAMTKDGTVYNYSFCSTSQAGQYIVNGITDIDGVTTNWAYDFNVRSDTNLTLLIILISLAVIFFIATLIVNEEFFVYISGVLFLVSGTYIMINGIDIVNDWYSRAISYVLIGIGFLFTLGAYIYNTNFKQDEDKDEF